MQVIDGECKIKSCLCLHYLNNGLKKKVIDFICLTLQRSAGKNIMRNNVHLSGIAEWIGSIEQSNYK